VPGEGGQRCRGAGNGVLCVCVRGCL
jgi:hypothetical protein